MQEKIFYLLIKVDNCFQVGSRIVEYECSITLVTYFNVSNITECNHVRNNIFYLDFGWWRWQWTQWQRSLTLDQFILLIVTKRKIVFKHVLQTNNIAKFTNLQVKYVHLKGDRLHIVHITDTLKEYPRYIEHLVVYWCMYQGEWLRVNVSRCMRRVVASRSHSSVG